MAFLDLGSKLAPIGRAGQVRGIMEIGTFFITAELDHQDASRSDDPKAREAPGTGLGLNITRNLVELQEGKIWFESEYGKGTTFHFTIPIADV